MTVGLKHPMRLPSLDGWRAVSILLVLGSHSPRIFNFPHSLLPVFRCLFDGDLGVRFFFTISGFLITWLLICEKNETGRINLWHFYGRRALRILPVYFAFISTLALLQLLTPFSQPLITWIGNLTFTTNFVPATWPSGHLWSLSVEEQFYFLWPGIFLLCGVAYKVRRPLKVLIAPVLVAPVCRVISFKGYCPAVLAPLFSHFSFFNYFDSLAIGCICAVAFAHKLDVIEKPLGEHRWLAKVIGGALILIPYSFPYLPMPGRISFAHAFAPSLQALGFAILMLQSIILPSDNFYRVLNWRWMVRIGVLSYSIYIWQQIFCAPPETFGWGKVWWISFPWWLATVFVVASASYYGFERPLLKLRSRLRKP